MLARPKSTWAEPTSVWDLSLIQILHQEEGVFDLIFQLGEEVPNSDFLTGEGEGSLLWIFG